MTYFDQLEKSGQQAIASCETTASKLFHSAYEHPPTMHEVAAILPVAICPTLILTSHSGREIVKEVAKGVGNEIVHHPIKLAGEVVAGVAIGFAAAALSPEVATGVGIAAGAIAAYKVAEAIPSIYRDARIVAHPEAAGPQELDAAKRHLQSIGETATDLAAGTLGSLSTGLVRAGMKSGYVGLEKFLCKMDGFPTGYNGPYKWNPWEHKNY